MEIKNYPKLLWQGDMQDLALYFCRRHLLRDADLTRESWRDNLDCCDLVADVVNRGDGYKELLKVYSSPVKWLYIVRSLDKRLNKVLPEFEKELAKRVLVRGFQGAHRMVYPDEKTSLVGDVDEDFLDRNDKSVVFGLMDVGWRPIAHVSIANNDEFFPEPDDWRAELNFYEPGAGKDKWNERLSGIMEMIAGTNKHLALV